MKPRPVIAGNWKMNMDPREVREFFRAFRPDFPPGRHPELLLFPPFVSLAAALEARPTVPAVAVGVQNIHWEPSGAFTGEISAPLARAAGATHVLVGHSERRHVFGEGNEDVVRKVEAALKAGLVPVVCVGETLEERRAGRLRDVILGQLDAFLPAVSGGAPASFLLAYEPVWAIGTGETATPDDASEAHGMLRGRLREELGDAPGDSTPILYGGSVKAGNAAELLRAPDVDGVLVGGASLDAASFGAIAEAGAPLT
jgi:triosephosphate isomerase (TIM)